MSNCRNVGLGHRVEDKDGVKNLFWVFAPSKKKILKNDILNCGVHILFFSHITAFKGHAEHRLQCCFQLPETTMSGSAFKSD